MSHPQFEQIASLGADLVKASIDDNDDTVSATERCLDILSSLEAASTTTNDNSCNMSIALLERTHIGQMLTKCNRAFKRHARTSDSNPNPWNAVLLKSQRLLSTWKEAAAKENKIKAAQKSQASNQEAEKSGPPSSVSAYRSRLVSQNKEMHKDPPVLPPSNVIIDATKQHGIPKRKKGSNELTFPPGTDEDVNTLLKSDFHPNVTPEEVLRAGAFGGTYFRPIRSAVTNELHKPAEVLSTTLQPEWIEGLNKSTLLCSSTYRNNVNKFGVKCGGSLGMWESSGWITHVDPYGWFQWYCRFYSGRRCSDDMRQIKRWAQLAGPKGRFRSQLCNKILAKNTTVDDASVSPVIRQTLLHWGLDITDPVMDAHRKRMKK